MFACHVSDACFLCFVFDCYIIDARSLCFVFDFNVSNGLTILSLIVTLVMHVFFVL